jgi:hypothetical protein
MSTVAATTNREGAMSEREQEAKQQHLLLMVESGLRAGRSEEEIVEILDDAAEADASIERAA